MLFKAPILDEIAKGRITLAFRRWQRPTVRAGSTLKTAIGVLAIESVEEIAESLITEDDFLRAGYSSRQELLDSLGTRPGTLYRIAFHRSGDDPRLALRSRSTLEAEELRTLNSRLARLDARSSVGPWTKTVLLLIRNNPECRAADLAAKSGFEKEWLKLNIRKLKNLGLTESLEQGYRIAPRGLAWLASQTSQEQ